MSKLKKLEAERVMNAFELKLSRDSDTLGQTFYVHVLIEGEQFRAAPIEAMHKALNDAALYVADWLKEQHDKLREIEHERN